MRRSETDRRNPGRVCALLFLLALGALAGGGCGSGGSTGDGPGPGGSRAAGRVAVTVNWPKPSSGRLLPVAAQSVRVRLLRGSAEEGVRVVSKNADGSPSSVVFENVVAGGLTMQASAHPNADGSGTAQARGDAPVTVVAGQTADVRLTMSSTIASVEVTPQNATVRVGATQPFVATPRDADGNVVLVTPATLRWSVEGAAGSIDAATGVFAASAVGAAGAVRARETESGREGTAAVTVLPPANVNDAIWPRFHGGPANAGYQGSAPAARGVADWDFQTVSASEEEAARSSPAIGADGTVYVGGAGGGLYALTPAGALRWRFDGTGAVTGGAFASPALGPDGSVYVVARAAAATQGVLYALDGATGAVKWEKPGYDPCCPLADDDGTVYASRTSGGAIGVAALDGATGADRWFYETGGENNLVGSPALGSRSGDAEPDTLFVCTERGALLALDRRTGAYAWALETFDTNFGASPAYHDGRVYVGSAGGNLYGVSAATGQKLWQRDVGGRVDAAPAVDHVTGRVFVGASDGRMRAFEGASGGQVWEAALGGAVRSSPAFAGGARVLYVGCDDGEFYALDARDGAILWGYTAFGRVGISPAIDRDGRVYFEADGGLVVCIGLRPRV